MAGFWAHGTTVSIATAAIGGLDSIQLPEQSRGDLDFTDHGSAGTMEFVPGLRDGGTLTVSGKYIPTDAGQVACRTNYAAAGTVAAIVITFPTTPVSTVTFDGYVNGMGGDAPYDNKATFSASFKVAGAVTHATAA